MKSFVKDPLVEEVQAQVEGQPRDGDKGLNHPSEADVEVRFDRGRSVHDKGGATAGARATDL